MSARPLFIVLEGCDGSGTTTQGDLLAEALRHRGRMVLRTAEPTRGEIGRLLRAVLRARSETPVHPRVVALLFAADRIRHCRTEIGPALRRGEIVVCDRYLASSLAFQVVDGEGGIDPGWLRSINAPILEPDLSLLIDVPTATSLRRIEARGQPRERFETGPTLGRVRRRYHRLFADPEAGLGVTLVIDGDRPAQVVAAELLEQVDRRLAQDP